MNRSPSFPDQRSEAPRGELCSDRILVIGASGFIGSHIMDACRLAAAEVEGTATLGSPWRAEALGLGSLTKLNLTDPESLEAVVSRFAPTVIVNCAAVGNNHLARDLDAMVQINVVAAIRVARWCSRHGVTLIHLGSSSEYGGASSGPAEDEIPHPNSQYAVTKLSATTSIQSLATIGGLSGAVLRLYSVFGPLEDPSRLVPTLIREGFQRRLPPFSPAQTAHDFVYVSDAVAAVRAAIVWARSTSSFDIFNIGTGKATTLAQVAEIAQSAFGIANPPMFGSNLRPWDLTEWFANSAHARDVLKWDPKITFREGLFQTVEWYRMSDRKRYLEIKPASAASSHEEIAAKAADSRDLVSFVVAVYGDEPAIGEMHARVVGVCAELGCGYEIVFVVDGSPDASADRVLEISRVDPRVRGICHARNFGSQAAFLSGMSVASGDAVVLLDGDLQDPPEVAREMILAWRRGAQLVLARRVGRDAPAAMRFAYRAFYRLLSRLSPYPIPRDVGDFCLMTREVYRQVTQMSEREPFIRVMRAYLGFRATTVDYYRPRRKYGRSTNSLLRNLQWAVSGFLAASRRPLTILGVAGAVLVALSIVGLLYQALVRFLNPSITPRGLTTVLLVVGTFGAMNLLATAVVGAYVGRVLEQTRHRPRFVVESLIADGKRRLSPAPVSSR